MILVTKENVPRLVFMQCCVPLPPSSLGNQEHRLIILRASQYLSIEYHSSSLNSFFITIGLILLPSTTFPPFLDRPQLVRALLVLTYRHNGDQAKTDARLHVGFRSYRGELMIVMTGCR